MAKKTASQQVASRLGNYELRHIRATLEAEMLAAADRGEVMTQAHIGQLEMLQAVGEELDRRGQLTPPPPFVDISHENGRRLSFAVRVFA